MKTFATILIISFFGNTTFGHYSVEKPIKKVSDSKTEVKKTEITAIVPKDNKVLSVSDESKAKFTKKIETRISIEDCCSTCPTFRPCW